MYSLTKRATKVAIKTQRGNVLKKDNCINREKAYNRAMTEKILILEDERMIAEVTIDNERKEGDCHQDINDENIVAVQGLRISARKSDFEEASRALHSAMPSPPGRQGI